MPTTLNILDIEAGSGSVIHSLALFLHSAKSFMALPAFHICYYSLDKHNSFQDSGLRFWRQYIQQKLTPINVYMNFDTIDILDDACSAAKIPNFFFDFIVITHGFFNDPHQRLAAFQIYKEIFCEKMMAKGHALIIISGTKLFEIYNEKLSDDLSQEQTIIQRLLEELNLKLIWYKYLTSTGSRTYHTNFTKYAQENLPYQQYMSSLRKLYLTDQSYIHDLYYTLNDYVILAQPNRNL